MRAVIYSELGSSEVLRLVEREPGVPGPGEVRVRIVRSGVNPTDAKSRTGTYGQAAFPEIVPNHDGAGVVDALGPGVADLAVGDRVWVTCAAIGRPTGTAQEFTVIPADRVFRLPDDVSFDLGAALGVPAVTAFFCLTASVEGPARLERGSLAGRTVLVQGGAGAVGNAAVQLGVWAGARVIATVSSAAKADLARAAGASETIDYKREDVVARVREFAPDGIDIVVEVAPAVNLAADLKVVKSRGTISFYGFEGGDTVELDLLATLMANARFQWIAVPRTDSSAVRAAGEAASAALADGGFGIGEEHGLPLHRYPLERTAAAHDAVDADTLGKILIDVSEA
jgi:NADPH:quinone reductase